MYSANALRYGLSTAIRLDTLWPRALAGYYRNPVFGSGYATLTKDSIGQFTEAESTDNNFLRTLGETGSLGFVTFYGVVMLALVAAWKLSRSHTAAPIEISFAIGFIAATLGLLINAGFIDVFAASKVAFYYWSLTGILFAIVLMQKQLSPPKKVVRQATKNRH
jgi:O-antigen ligase